MQGSSPLFLLRTKRFLPLFLTQALGAFNDNLYKQALIMLITYRLADSMGFNSGVMVAIANSLLMAPYFLFSATAGQFADKFEKSLLIQRVKQLEIVIMLLACGALFMANLWALMFIIFLLGVQATFFGPLKYSILPDHLKENELVPANSLIEASTFLMILAGTIFGGELIMSDVGQWIICAGLIGFAVLGWLASRDIPQAQPPEPELVIDRNIWRESWRIIGFAKQNRSVMRAILGISWLWLIGAVFISQFPAFARYTLHGGHSVATWFLIVFSVGVGSGSILCNKLTKHRVDATYVPIAALVMTVFIIDLYFASSGLPAYAEDSELRTFSSFIRDFSSWRILLDLLGISIASGVYIVPLYTIMQSRSDKQFRSRIIAANNIINAVFMVSGSIIAALLIAEHYSIQGVFLTMGVANLIVALYICSLLPDKVMRLLVRRILKLCYHVKVCGLENYEKAGERALIIANHTSFLDAALIACFLPDKVTFAVNTHISQKWWMRPFLALVDAYPIDPTNPMATKALIEKLRGNNKVMIFPEGRITVTGSLMKIYEGPGMIADKANAMLLPIRIDGAQYTPFSRLRGKVRLHWFPRITLTLLEPRRFHPDPSLKGRKRRTVIGNQLYDVMTQMMFESSKREQTLFSALIDASKLHGGKHVIFEDIERHPITYRQLLTRCFVLGQSMARDTTRGQHVGLLLPNMVSAAVSFFGLQAIDRVPAMLNFSTGTQNMVAACRAAQIVCIYTSRRFIQTAKLVDAIKVLEETGISVRYLEDLRERITTWDKLRGALMAYIPYRAYAALTSIRRPVLAIKAEDRSGLSRDMEEIKRMAGRLKRARRAPPSPSSPAVILFTSGSEGTPKAVVLSHANLQANRYQLASRVDFGPQDVVFNVLPIFHSFGLTGGMILPVLSGIRIFLYPSPLHYRIVPELIYDTNATILFGTDTFLAGYARFAHPYDFHHVRLVFSGAEKVKEETRKVWSEKFGLRILEGYGTTETSPVIAVNTPMQNQRGTVGRLLPGIHTFLEHIPGIEDGQRLYVSGPNVMQGYYKAENPGVLTPSVEIAPAVSPYPWHDTGDIVAFDEEGYIHIKGRAKRFAKIGGEMVSLTAVEHYLNELWPGQMHAVVTLPDAKKGEQIVLLTDYKEAQRDDIIGYTRYHGISELAVPRTIITLPALPLLGTGKIDYVKARKLAESGSFELG